MLSVLQLTNTGHVKGADTGSACAEITCAKDTYTADTSVWAPCVKDAGTEGILVRGAYTKYTCSGNASIGAASIEGAEGTSITIVGIRDGCVGDACVKDTGAVRNACFRDAGIVGDACFKNVSAVKNACFKDTGTVNCL